MEVKDDAKFAIAQTPSDGTRKNRNCVRQTPHLTNYVHTTKELMEIY